VPGAVNIVLVRDGGRMLKDFNALVATVRD
jgi:hypothetical protein